MTAIGDKNAAAHDRIDADKTGSLDVLNSAYNSKQEARQSVYDKDNPVYDKCACRELAGKDDEYPEQLVKGTQIEVVLAGQYDNPDYDPDETDSDEPEKLDWYLAVETEGIYQGKLTSQITGSDPAAATSKSTINVKDSGGEEITLTVHSTALGSTQKIEADTGIIATRISGQLVITKARCPT